MPTTSELVEAVKKERAKSVESPPSYQIEVDTPPYEGIPSSYPMARIDACIRGEAEVPMEVLLTACALRHGEARVPPGAFREESVTSIALPDGLTSIGEGAFAGCSSMTSIVLPSGLTSIGEGAFAGCYELTSIELPAGLTSLGGQTVGRGTGYWCT